MIAEIYSFTHSFFTHCKTITAQPSHINCRRYGNKRQAVFPTIHLHSDVGKQAIQHCGEIYKHKSMSPKAKMDGNFSDHVDLAPPSITLSVIKRIESVFIMLSICLVLVFILHSSFSSVANWSSGHRVSRWRWLCLTQSRCQQTDPAPEDRDSVLSSSHFPLHGSHSDLFPKCYLMNQTATFSA